MRALLSLLLIMIALPAFAQAPSQPPAQAPASVIVVPMPTRAPPPPPPSRAPLTELPFDAAPAQMRPPSPPPAAEPAKPDPPPTLPPETERSPVPQEGMSSAPAPPPVAAPPAAMAPAPDRTTRALTELPLDTGLPLVVRAGLAFVDVGGIDENDESFTATVDLRLSWMDLRLRYPPEEVPIGYREWRGLAAREKLATIWSPKISFDNLRGDPTRESRSLRLYPDGRVELLRRIAGAFSSRLDVQRFPFDRQQLQVQLVSQEDTADKVTLDYRQDDLLFSRVDPSIAIGGWTIGAVNLTRNPLAGWYGETYARLRVALEVDRQSLRTVPALFVPLLASLLIPLLATWLNRLNNGEFEIHAFELTNIVIGGLFAVIALNFTINSERSILAESANTVSLLFGLNYLALAAALIINIGLFRFNVVRVLAGRHVQHEVARYITWALPIAIAATAAALILIAAA